MRLSFLIILLTLLALSCKKESVGPTTLYQTDFSSGDKWSKHCDSDYCLDISSGSATFSMYREHWLAVSIAPSSPINTEYIAQIDLTLFPSDSTKFASGGLAYNANGNSNYRVFSITNGGKFRHNRYLNGAVTEDSGFQSTPFINLRPGAINSLRIEQDTNVVEFFINGHSIGSFPNQISYKSGVGLFVLSGTQPKFAPVTITFDNLSVKSK